MLLNIPVRGTLGMILVVKKRGFASIFVLHSLPHTTGKIKSIFPYA